MKENSEEYSIAEAEYPRQEQTWKWIVSSFSLGFIFCGRGHDCSALDTGEIFWVSLGQSWSTASGLRLADRIMGQEWQTESFAYWEAGRLTIDALGIMRDNLAGKCLCVVCLLLSMCTICTN